MINKNVFLRTQSGPYLHWNHSGITSA